MADKIKLAKERFFKKETKGQNFCQTVIVHNIQMEKQSGDFLGKKENFGKIRYAADQAQSCSCNIKMSYNMESW